MLEQNTTASNISLPIIRSIPKCIEMIKDIDIFSDAKNILKRLIENGYKAYIVGGCVRDSLMHKCYTL